jgi:probable rRNA maturation factor
MKLLRLFNRQKTQAVDTVRWRQIAKYLLEEGQRHDSYQLGVHLIGASEMANLNATFLQHSGSTDVITFNHQEEAGAELYGEIFISMDDAVTQASLFATSWPSEIVRYLIHGILHLEGHDDLESGPRRAMKREENKLVKALSRRFDLGKLERAKRYAKGK